MARRQRATAARAVKGEGSHYNRRTMQREYHRWYTGRLGPRHGRRASTAIGARRCWRSRRAAATNGRWKARAWSAALAEFIDGGRIKLFTVGSNGDQSFYNKGAHPLPPELDAAAVGRVHPLGSHPVHPHHCHGLVPIATMGASLGAYHAANTLFKHPDAVRACFAMSGVYDMRRFMDGFSDDNFYFNNPIDYIGGMTDPRPHRPHQQRATSTSPPATVRGNTRRTPTTSPARSASRASATTWTTGARSAGTTGRTGNT